MARRSAEARRAKQTRNPEVARSDPAETGEVDQAQVIAALRRKAYDGDVAAARELREWLARFDPATSHTNVLDLLTASQRQQVREWVLENGED